MNASRLLLATLLFCACFAAAYVVTPGSVASSPQARRMILDANAGDIEMKSARFQFSLTDASFDFQRGMECTFRALTKLDVWSPQSDKPVLTMSPGDKMRLRYLSKDEVRVSLMELVGIDSDFVLSESSGSASVTITNPDSVRIKIRYVYPHSNPIQLWLGTGATIEIDRQPSSIYSAFVTPSDRLNPADMAELVDLRVDGSGTGARLAVRLQGFQGNVTAAKELRMTLAQGSLEVDRHYNISIAQTLVIAPTGGALLTVARVDSAFHIKSSIFLGYVSIDGSAIPTTMDWGRILIVGIAGFLVALIPVYIRRERPIG